LPPEWPDPTITLAGTEHRHFSYGEDWQAALLEAPAGGFFAQRAVDDFLNGFAADSPTYPVSVVVGYDPIFTDDLSYHYRDLPAGKQLYYLRDEDCLSALPDQWYGTGVTGDCLPVPGEVETRAYPDQAAPQAYLASDGKGSLIRNLDHSPKEMADKSSKWEAAAMQYNRYLVNRQAGKTDYAPWLAEVRSSFEDRILMPTTAFIVVENEAQREALRRKQEQVLSADPNFDLTEATEMSEPGWWVFLLALPFWIWFSPALRRP
ncbi:MAG: hypothetical protein WA952_13255, partial [Lewinella sp.]